MKYHAKGTLPIFMMLLLSVVIVMFAAQLSAQELPVEPQTGFEIEGNTAWDQDGDYDWENVEDKGAVRFLDPNSKVDIDPTTFKPDGKFDKPEEWSILPGNVGPSQNELTNTTVWAVRPGELGSDKPDDFWLIMGMERTKKEGTFFLDFEYNQKVWDGSSGGLTRTPGDLVVGFELKGNPIDRMKDLTVLVAQYLPGAQPNLCEVTPGNGNMPERVVLGSDPCPAYGDSGWYYRYLSDGGILASSGVGMATMNEEAFDAPWPSTDNQGNPRDTIPPFEFAEAAINLTAFGIEPTCATFSSAHAKSRSSLEPKADLKDVSEPAPISTNCRIDGHKFLDVNGNGVWDRDEPPLADWEITLLGGDEPASTTTDEDGYYEFEWLADGVYTVQEVCPDGWVQTMPGMTGFDNCGEVTHDDLEINIRHREINDLDFGNGRPEIDAVKRCSPDVFLGDDVEVEIIVTNTGNVDLHEVTVKDDMINLNEIIPELTPGQVMTYTGSYTTANGNGSCVPVPPPPDEHVIFLPVIFANGLAADRNGLAPELNVADPVTNTVTVTAQYATVSVSDSDTCTTEVHELSVSKDAQTSLNRQYVWTIDKVSDASSLTILFPGQPAFVTYTVGVDLAQPPTRDRDWAVSGEIVIENPAPMDAELSKVTDVVSPGIAATVVCPSMIVPAGGSLTCTYGPVALPSGGTQTNTATAFLPNNNGSETCFEGSREFDFEDAEVTEIDKEVQVFDTNLVTEANPDGLIGTLGIDDLPETFTYKEQIGPFSVSECQAGVHDNTARIRTNDTLTVRQAIERVPYLCVTTVTVAFEDLPFGANDWDYNDIVVDVGVVLLYSGAGDLERVSFTFDQGGEFAAFTHSFNLRPTAFACGGTYSRWIGGVPVETNVDYDVGDNIVIIENSGWTPQRVALTIDFDVPEPGACPLDLSQPEFDLIGAFNGENLFFAPWILVNNSFQNTQYPVEPGDSRLLNVPADWVWPPERVAIWTCYPDGVSPPIDQTVGPVFSELWWQPTSRCQ